MPDTLTLTARWVFPVASPPLECGLLTIAGDRVAAVQPRGTCTPDLDLGDVAIIPGLVNAHTHLDLTGARGKAPPTSDFTAWLRSVIGYRRQRTPEQVQTEVRMGIAECLRYGTTLVGDIAAEGTSWDALSAAPLRAVVFRELIGVSPERAAVAWEGFQWWQKSVEATETCRPGVSPHAPYSVAESLYVQATNTHMPLTIHLAESLEELDLLGDRCGSFETFLKDLGAWAPERLMYSPWRAVELSDPVQPNVFVHCNYLSAASLTSFNYGTVVYCPRTHATFGHRPHPFRQFLNRGVRVAIGTDSLASNPDLDVLAEARHVHSHHPDLSGAVLLCMATLSGAGALGWSAETGCLDPGKSADFAVVGLPSRDEADPHRLLFDSDRPVRATWFRGQPVYSADG
jgi:cytosine/adenosine deaminase-related metal-dependent hydrolase